MDSPYTIFSTTESAWAAMREAIVAAKESIYWEVYIFKDDEIGRDFFDLLEQKAKDGLDVKLIVDAFGSRSISKKRLDSLRQSGVDLLIFSERHHRLANWWRRIYVRTHRKILLVDHLVGFVGGVNVEAGIRYWNDIHVSVTGRVVHSLERSFAKSYIIGGGEAARVSHLFKYRLRFSPLFFARRREDVSVQLIDDSPHQSYSTARDQYIHAFRQARRQVILFSPYYFPDKHFMKALWQARRRGIRVDLLIPFRSDIRIAAYATYAGYALLQRYGVNIHFLRSMMHGKGAIIDDDVAIVGTSNLDQTSFFDNYEINLKIRDRQFVSRLRSIVDGWMQKDKTLDLSSASSVQRAWLRVSGRVSAWIYTIWHRH